MVLQSFSDACIVARTCHREIVFASLWGPQLEGSESPEVSLYHPSSLGSALKGSEVGERAGFVSHSFSQGQKDVVLGLGPLTSSEPRLWGCGAFTFLFRGRGGSLCFV